MNNKLTQQQEGFTLDYFSTDDPARSYMNHYSCKSLAVASAAASRLLKNVNVQARLKELRDKQAKELLERTIATKLEAGQVATEILRARFSDFDIDNPTSEQMNSPALREVRRTSGLGKDGNSPWQSTTIKLESPLAAAEFLAKLYGWYEILPLGFNDNRQYNLIVADEESKESIKRILNRERRQLPVGTENPEEIADNGQ